MYFYLILLRSFSPCFPFHVVATGFSWRLKMFIIIIIWSAKAQTHAAYTIITLNIYNQYSRIITFTTAGISSSANKTTAWPIQQPIHDANSPFMLGNVGYSRRLYSSGLGRLRDVVSPCMSAMCNCAQCLADSRRYSQQSFYSFSPAISRAFHVLWVVYNANATQFFYGRPA